MKAKTKYYFYRISVDIMLVLLFVFLFYKEYLHYGLLLRSILILGLLVLYKWMAIQIGLDYYSHKKHIVEFDAKDIKSNVNVKLAWCLDLEEDNENKRKLVIRIKKFLNSKIVKKYPIIMDIIFWVLRLLPWNWMYYFFSKIGGFMFNALLLINSNKDVYYKKRNINMVQSDWSLWEYEIYHYLRWLFVYPILRLLLVFKKFRKRILKYKSIVELIRIRFIVYLYSVFYLYIGYYDFVREFSFIYKLIFILIITGIVWPLVIVFTTKTEEKYKENLEFYLPAVESFVTIKNTSISLYLLSIFLDQVKTEKNSYLQLKYDFIGLTEINEVTSIYFLNKFVFYGRKAFPNLMWKYDKLYGIPFICYGKIIKYDTHKNFFRYLFVYQLGEKELGVKRMKKYELSLKKLKELYKCRMFLLMDMRRLLMFKKEKWMVLPKRELDELKNINYFWEIEDIYKCVPANYIMKLDFYNLIWKYSMYIIYIFIEEFEELDVKFGVNKEYVLMDIMKEVKKVKEIDLYRYEEETRLENFLKVFIVK